MIISFSGIDGSGKSMQAKLLVKHLNDQGIRAVLIEPYQISLFLNLGRLLSLVRPDKSYAERHSAKKELPLKTTARCVALFFDIFIFNIVEVFWLLLGFCVVCDRYLYDTLAHIIYTGTPPKRVVDFYIWIIRAPHIAFLLECDEKISLVRENVHTSVDYFKVKNRIYHRLAHYISFTFVNTDGDINASWEAVRSKVGLGFPLK